MEDSSLPNDTGGSKASGHLNPLTDEAEELFLRALDEAGCPRETTRKILAGEDPRPRHRLPDGTELVVEYVPAPDYRTAREAFVRLCAEQVGIAVTPERRDAFLRQFQQLSLDLATAVRAAALHDNKEVDERTREALADPPDPYDEPTWDRWADRAWQKIRSAVAGPLWREVMGEDARRGEGKVQDLAPEDFKHASDRAEARRWHDRDRSPSKILEAIDRELNPEQRELLAAYRDAEANLAAATRQLDWTYDRGRRVLGEIRERAREAL